MGAQWPWNEGICFANSLAWQTDIVPGFRCGVKHDLQHLLWTGGNMVSRKRGFDICPKNLASLCSDQNVAGPWIVTHPPIFRHRQTQMCFKCLQRLHQLCIWYPEVSQARSGSTTGGGPRRVLLFLMFEHMGLNMNMFKQFKPYYLI